MLPQVKTWVITIVRRRRRIWRMDTSWGLARKNRKFSRGQIEHRGHAALSIMRSGLLHPERRQPLRVEWKGARAARAVPPNLPGAAQRPLRAVLRMTHSVGRFLLTGGGAACKTVQSNDARARRLKAPRATNTRLAGPSGNAARLRHWRPYSASDTHYAVLAIGVE